MVRLPSVVRSTLTTFNDASEAWSAVEYPIGAALSTALAFAGSSALSEKRVPFSTTGVVLEGSRSEGVAAVLAATREGAALSAAAGGATEALSIRADSDTGAALVAMAAFVGLVALVGALPFRSTMTLPVATTSSAAAMRHATLFTTFLFRDTGITFAGTLSSAVSIRDDAARNPRASAAAAEQSAHSAMCAAVRAASPGASASSSQA